MCVCVCERERERECVCVYYLINPVCYVFILADVNIDNKRIDDCDILTPFAITYSGNK